ncbi:MAG: hypothetical protein J4431_02360 [Candidatus Aenigmarchaeota archaeon]|nr:hypothetical protein [Candidatus Aenigmarchaeota archaeon]
MKPFQVGIIAGFVVAAVFLANTMLTPPTGHAVKIDYDAFTQCLADKGVKFYGTYWCKECTEQQKEFGLSWQNINATDCAMEINNPGICSDAGVNKYPTWEFADGTRKQGRLSSAELGALTGCPLEK